jgi:hypothetical protein
VISDDVDWAMTKLTRATGFDVPEKSPPVNTVSDHGYHASTNKPHEKRYLEPTT